MKYNVSHLERQVIYSLKRKNDIVLKEADKGSAIIIMDKEFYIEKSEEIICDPTAYQEVDANSDHKSMKIITDFIQKYSGELAEKETKYLADFEFKTSNLYCLLKIHKSKIINEAITTQNTEIITVHAPHDLKMRPIIIVGPACPTHQLSHLLDQLLRPLVQYVEANVRDSLDMLSCLPQKLEGGNQLSTFDVNNL